MLGTLPPALLLCGNQQRPGVNFDWEPPLPKLQPPPEWASIDLIPKFNMPSFA